MAVMCLTSTYLAIGGVDKSADVKSVTLTVDVNPLDTTDFASAGWTEVIGGLKSGTLAVTFQDDFADSAIDNDLWDIIGTVATFEVRPTSSAVGAGNPKWTGSVLIQSLPVGGSVGDLVVKSVSWPTTGAVTRAEA